MQVDYLTFDSNEILDFDGELRVLQQHMQKQVVQLLDPFLSFMLSLQPHKAHNMLAMMLNPHCKGLGLVILYVGKEMTFHIIDEYDR
jgi:hypothetical protein